MTFSDFLNIVDYVISFVVFFGGVLAYFFRVWIKNWISTRFSKAVNRELEEQRHQLNKEMEAYRDSLLRELEKFRANIDIRRSIALKTAEAKLDALRALYADYFVAIRALVTHAKMNAHLRQIHHLELMGKLEKYYDAERAANIFIPSQVALDLASSFSELVDLANGPLIEKEEDISEPMERAVRAGNSLKAVIDEPIIGM